MIKNLETMMYSYQVIDDLTILRRHLLRIYLDKKPMCSPQQSGWKSLVDFQKGLKTIDRILKEETNKVIKYIYILFLAVFIFFMGYISESMVEAYETRENQVPTLWQRSN